MNETKRSSHGPFILAENIQGAEEEPVAKLNINDAHSNTEQGTKVTAGDTWWMYDDHKNVNSVSSAALKQEKHATASVNHGVEGWWLWDVLQPQELNFSSFWVNIQLLCAPQDSGWHVWGRLSDS